MSRRAVAGLAAVGVAASVLFIGPSASADYIRDMQYWLTDYGIRDAWNVTRGAGVTIAIIDTGVDGGVDDLSKAVVGGSDFSGIGSPDGQGPVGEDGAHGTWVASLAAGHGHGAGAASGIIGTAPDAKLLAISVGFGVGTSSTEDQIANGVRWAVDNGADIINLSLTRNTLEWPESWDDAFLYAMEKDVVVIAAAGNRGSGTTVVGAPATMPGVLVVGGVDRKGKASWNASSQGITISVSAPSEELVGVSPGGGYVQWAGTSGAAPIVAGVAALVRAAHPDLDAGNVINRIVSTARAVGSSPSPIYGYGLVDANAAVRADVATVDEKPAELLKEWIRLHRRAATDPGEPAGDASSPPSNPAAPPSLPQGPSNPMGSVLPDVEALRNVGVPLLVYAGFGAVLVAWAIGFRRSMRKSR